MVKVHTPKKGKYIRIRVRNPKKFQRGTFRTHDIGRRGHSKRIAGKLKTGPWATQAFLVLKSDRHLVSDFLEQAKRLTSKKKKRKHKR
jgi:hypothetical protein